MWPLLLLAAFASASPRLPLTFDDILSRADAHPRLEAETAAIAAKRAREDEISDLSSNPSLQVLPGFRLPGAADSGFEVQAALSQSIDLGGIGPKARRASRAERTAMAANRRADALAARLDAAHAWISLFTRDAELRQAAVERDLARALADRVARAVDLGVALDTEALEARLYAETLERVVIDAEGRAYEQALALAEALSLPGAPLPAARGDPPDPALPPPDEWPSWIARAEQLPSALAVRLAARAAQLRSAEEAAQASLRIAPTIAAQTERPGDVVLFGGLSVQLPLFERNARARGEADAAAARADGEAAMAVTAAERALRLALHEVAHAREVEAQVRKGVVPTAERFVDRAVRRFEAGETDVFPVLRARQRLAEARVTLIGVEAMRRWAEMKAWLLLASLPATKASLPS